MATMRIEHRSTHYLTLHQDHSSYASEELTNI